MQRNREIPSHHIILIGWISLPVIFMFHFLYLANGCSNLRVDSFNYDSSDPYDNVVSP